MDINNYDYGNMGLCLCYNERGVTIYGADNICSGSFFCWYGYPLSIYMGIKVRHTTKKQLETFSHCRSTSNNDRIFIYHARFKVCRRWKDSDLTLFHANVEYIIGSKISW